MKLFSLLLCLLSASACYAQKVFTKNGNISFLSKTALENITADNNQVTSILNQQTGDLQFSVLIKAFHFKKALMEEHFNENYMESDKFPKAIFKGLISDHATVNFGKDGSYPVIVNGDLSIHGVSKRITVQGTLQVKNGLASASCAFNVKPSDYGITIPKLVKDNISETIHISVNCNYNQRLKG
ncbi:MAG: YceI family protein [Chitinophagaceae bacterium]|nr:MAG: YceI family protein [Chitinophagaceae bacterium]